MCLCKNSKLHLSIAQEKGIPIWDHRQKLQNVIITAGGQTPLKSELDLAAQLSQ